MSMLAKPPSGGFFMDDSKFQLIIIIIYIEELFLFVTMGKN